MTGNDDWFAGAVDFHVHSRPSLFPRRFDDVELCRHAAEASMASIVIKAHEGSTVERATLAERSVDGLHVHGGIVLNRFVGGFNPHAVEVAVALGARVVWMPTVHASNHVRFYGGTSFREQKASIGSRELEPLTVLDSGDQIKAEVVEVLEVLAETPNVVLSSGHLGARETNVLFREARRYGIERLLVAHPALPVTGFDADIQKELADVGAVIEHTYLPHLTRWGGFPIDVTAANIRHVGVERCILASDLGQRASPSPAEGLLDFGRELIRNGLGEDAVRRMLVDNPSALLA